MGLFSKSKNILGIDLGSTSIKIVELKKEKPIPKLVTYGYIEKASGDILRGNEEEVKKKTVELLKKLSFRAGVTTGLAVTALPSFAVFSSVIILPSLPDKELKEAIIREIRKIIPLPSEKAVLDWKILEKFVPSKKEGEEKIIKKGKEDYKILINIASKKLVRDYMEIFKEANFQLLSLETESFALARSLVGKDLSTVMIIDFSAVSTDIIIVEKMIPVLSRSIDIGGLTITKSLAQSLNLDFKKAEQFKRDLRSTEETNIPLVIENTLKSLTEEIRYLIESYRARTGKGIEKVILSGGSAYLPKLDEYFSKELDMKVVISNPWKRVSYPIELEPALIEIAPRFSVAIGLALR